MPHKGDLPRHTVRSREDGRFVYTLSIVVPIIGSAVMAWQFVSRISDPPKPVASVASPAVAPRAEVPRADVARAEVPRAAVEKKVEASVIPTPPVAAPAPAPAPREPVNTGTVREEEKSRASVLASASPELAQQIIFSNRPIVAPVPTKEVAEPRKEASPPPAPVRRQASIAPEVKRPSAEASASSGAGRGASLADLNSASVERLNKLGVGLVGRAIVRGRPYASTDDLVEKRVLKRTAFERIKDQVTVD